jgi:Ca-activated chloride channel family protein
MIHFVTPAYLLLLLPLLGMWVYGRRRRRGVALVYPAFPPLGEGGRSLKLRLRYLPAELRLLAIILLIVGLARPQGGQAQEVVHGQGVAIALAVDISGTMVALDFAPQNRLEAVKSALADFITQRPYDPIGLVVFAEEAYVQAPLTPDHATVLAALDRIQLASQLGVADGTAIGLGLAHAASLLKDVDASSKAVILLTDGVNTVNAVAPLHAAEAARSLGIRIYTVGVGKDGPVQVPLNNGTTTILKISPDEVTLQAIAERTNGRYFRAQSTKDLQQIYQTISQLEPSDIQIEVVHPQAERMDWFIWPAFALLVLAFGLQHTWLRPFP